jgi:hypothetical protein
MNKIVAIAIAIIFASGNLPAFSSMGYKVRAFQEEDSVKKIEKWHKIESRKIAASYAKGLITGKEYKARMRKLRLLKDRKIEALEKR